MKLTDFFTKQKIELNNNDISMYVCGPTVYSDPHIGNMRPIIIFDVLNKVASLRGDVNFVHNITDVDDKIIRRASEEGVSEIEISERYAKEYLELLERLNIKMPTSMPKVTENIEGIIEFIGSLINKGYAYESNGSVYFSVDKYDSYARLLNVDISTLIDNEENQDKENSNDFALWKNTDEGIKWDSPWGQGRPGWHTECSFFIKKYFGDEGVDIHGGGIDLKFPHHINEMAQYETCCGLKHTSSVWSYVGHINLGEDKMSKSLGNIISAKDFINEHGAHTLRMVMMQTSMLNPISLNDDVIKNAKTLVDKIRNSIKKSLLTLAFEAEFILEEVKPEEDFISILEDDLDIVKSITYILEQVKQINSGIIGNENVLMNLIANLKLIGFEFKINYNDIREELKVAKAESNYEVLDKLREEVVK